MGIGMSCMDDDEYALLDYPNGKEIRHGPGITTYMFASGTKYKMPRLTNEQYLEVTHLSPQRDGNLVEIINGPALCKISDAYARIGEIKPKVRLGVDDYIIVKDVDGNMVTIEGPTLYCPKAYDSWSDKKKKLK